MTALVVRILGLVLGTLGSLYALYEHIVIRAGVESGLNLCQLGGKIDCTRVLGSEYATFLSIPLASWGLFFYLSLVPIAIKRRAALRPAARFALFALSASAVIISIGLFILAVTTLDAVCLACTTMYAANFLLLLGSLIPEGGLGIASLREGRDEWLSYIGVGAAGASPAHASETLRTLFFSVIVASACTWGMAKSMHRLVGERPASTSVSGPETTGQPQRSIPLFLEAGPNMDFHTGPADAPVVVVEFADLMCGACKSFKETFSAIHAKYADKVLFVFKNYPLDHLCNPRIQQPLHVGACALAVLTRCAGEQDKFWEALDEVWNLPHGLAGEEAARVLTERIGLDSAALQECTSGNRHLEKIRSDIQLADSLGLQGTPFVLVNGQVINRPSPAAMEALLASLTGKPAGQTETGAHQ